MLFDVAMIDIMIYLQYYVYICTNQSYALKGMDAFADNLISWLIHRSALLSFGAAHSSKWTQYI